MTEQNDHLKSMLDEIKNLPFHPNDDVSALRQRIDELETQNQYLACQNAEMARSSVALQEQDKSLIKQVKEMESSAAVMREAFQQLDCEPHSTCANAMISKALSTTAGADFLVSHKLLKQQRDDAIKEAIRRDQKWMDGIDEALGQKLDYGDPCSRDNASKVLGEFVARHKAMEVERDDAIKCLQENFKGVIAIRCTKHYRVPPYNRNECMGGGECPVCEVEKLQQEIAQLKGFKVVLDHICDIVTEFPNTNENVTVAVERIKRERDQARTALRAMEVELAEAKRLIAACLNTGGLRTDSTRQLYLGVCAFLKIEP